MELYTVIQWGKDYNFQNKDQALAHAKKRAREHEGKVTVYGWIENACPRECTCGGQIHPQTKVIWESE